MLKWIVFMVLAIMVGTALADPMPEFKLPNELGKNVALQDLLGRGPVLIDFWADYCQPCKLSMPSLNDLALKYDSLTVVLVSIDAPKMQTKAKAFLKSKGFQFVTLFDADKLLAKKLNVVNPPHTFLLDKTGEIVWSHLGYEPGNEAEYELQIRSLLGLEPEAGVEGEAEVSPDAVPKSSETECGGCEN